MKLIHFGESGNEKPGVCICNKIYDGKQFISDYNEIYFCRRWIGYIKKIVENISHTFYLLFFIEPPIHFHPAFTSVHPQLLIIFHKHSKTMFAILINMYFRRNFFTDK